MKINKIICTVGLPGSGKSRFAKQFRDKPGYIVIHLDTERMDIINRRKNLINEDTIFVLDGFMRADIDVINFVRQLVSVIHESVEEIGVLEIHVWEVDKDACHKNAIKRGRPCTNTIDRSTIKTIDPDKIKSVLGKVKSCYVVQEKVYTGEVGERLFEFGDYVKAGKIQPDLEQLLEFYGCKKSVKEIYELLGLREEEDIRTGELFLLLEKLGCNISRPYGRGGKK